ncbi:retropepsin-like aspartic protease family protein [Neptunicella marina]|uniref:Clan AA aspartic protease n=1 Tax=Neptunicella marina TaxID=2125989 RepID=A0A8J6IS23_9ALTE|nr:retropepsin-like aspartic protease [Neptunicella marina]MBC3764682.1 clan AA aspartic protease [Neptunicella marina]
MKNNLLWLLLCLSLAMNIWQYKLAQDAEQQGYTAINSSEVSQQQDRQTNSSNGQAIAAAGLISADIKRQQMLKRAQNLLRQQQYAGLNTLLTEYLSAHPQDFAFLLLEADLHSKTQLLSEALLGYYDLLDKVTTDEQRKQVLKRINELSQNAIQSLTQTQSWDVLARFVEPLYQVDSNNVFYSLALARAYAMLDQFNLMESVLTGIDSNLAAVREIRELAKSDEANATSPNQNSDDYIASIPLTQIGQQYVVDVGLDGQQSRLLIDTGASVTALSQRFFQRYFQASQYQFLGQFNLHTAAGDIEAPIYTFDEIVLGNTRLHHINVAVLPMSEQRVDGLLGMNVLSAFHFSIDQPRQLLLLKEI